MDGQTDFSAQQALLACIGLIAILAVVFVVMRWMKRRRATAQRAATMVRREERDRLWQEHIDAAPVDRTPPAE